MARSTTPLVECVAPHVFLDAADQEQVIRLGELYRESSEAIAATRRQVPLSRRALDALDGIPPPGSTHRSSSPPRAAGC